MTAQLRIPAKINLHLEVIGRRPDGYCELRTLLQAVDLFDELEAEGAEDGVLELEVDPVEAVDAGPDNLVTRAAHTLWRRVGARPGARLSLRKRIPVGAGLGGGSADAAAALVLLDALWSLELEAGELVAAARELGSDVTFFLHGGLALGVGRGDEVYPLPDLDELGVVVVHPEVEISTEEVYSRVDRLTWNPQEANVYAFAAGLDDRLRWEAAKNHLQAIVLEGWPEVAEALADLETTRPLHAAVTGSGSSVFALYRSRQAAEGAGSVLEKRWRVHRGVTLARARSRPVVKNTEGMP